MLARELTPLRIPAVAVLGNHDFESGKQDEVRQILTDAGLPMLDGDACELQGIGIAGVKGFGGGFGPRALGPWGETIIKQFVHEAVNEALKLEAALARLRTPQLIALLHYSPIQQTVEGEPLEIYPFLGSSRLEEPINRYPVSLVVHGHAHRGQLEGRTKRQRAGLQRVDAAADADVSRSAAVPRVRTCRPADDRRASRRRHSTAAGAGPIPRDGARATPSRPEDLHGNLHRPGHSRPSRRFLHRRAAQAAGHRHSVSGRRRVRVLALLARAARHQGHRHLRQARRSARGCSQAFEQLGYETEMPFPHWLGKIHRGAHFMDVIFSSGNGVARVDDLWFEHATKTNVLGVIVRLSPAEEMIWSKAFIQERERYDGADVAHLLRETGPSLDWPRLLMRFGDYWRVLLSQLILFGFVYPDKRQNVPQWVMDELMRRLERQPPEPAERRLLRHAAVARAVSPRRRAAGNIAMPARSPTGR